MSTATLPASSARRSSWRRLLVVATLGGLAVFLWLRPEPHPNVLLISIDTLRADRLGCYGYARPTSPSIDAFAKDAVVFRQAIAQAPSTLPSHASILTSLHPHEHQASVARKTALPPAVLTLAEVLRSEGFATAAYTGFGQLDPIYGLDQGFETYERAPSDAFLGTVEAAIAWLRRAPHRPWFLFLHTYETHHPYAAEARFLDVFDDAYDGPLPRAIDIDLLKRINRGELALGANDLQHLRNAYDAEIRSMDEAFGKLMRFLRKKGLYDDMLVILTSDHGEEFGEHGKVGWHSHTLYDELLKVPLVIKLPGSRAAGRAPESQVRSIDIAPTVLGAVGVDAPAAFRGADLVRWLDAGEAPELVAVSERDARGRTRVRSSLRTDGWKLWSPRLFDLSADPAETVDVAEKHADLARELEASLAELLSRAPTDAPREVEPGTETIERLRALGYVN